ncbi:MAG: adenylate/guanylate cyclase domain-containing protein [Mycobacterium sp.]
MSSRPSAAQRLGRVLERLTRQSGRLTKTPAYGSLLLGKVSESPNRRHVRIQVILTLFILTVNVIGIALALLLDVVAFPEPSVISDVPGWVPFIATPAYILLAMVFGTWWIHRRTVNDLRWAIDGRPPTQDDLRSTLLTPWRIALSHLVLWGGGAVLLTVLFGMYDPLFIPRISLTVIFCGLVVATTCYLTAEFALRPVAAEALAAGRPPRRLAPGIMGRTVVVWLLSSGVPVIGIGLTAMFSLILGNLTKTQLEVAVVISSVLSVLVGFILMWILAWLTSTPVRMVRAALRRVEEGDLDASVVVFDGTELGELQRGFNSMVAGLREREQVRDLFGRHVGREVAAMAEMQRPKLGGEERHVAVMFVDVVGSTRLVSTLPPKEVVDLLNRFFSIVVEEVDRHRGLVNKFEGDATLAIFGAPVAMENPEGEALAAARTISRRLEREVPECPARIGVAAGQVVAGNVGAKERFEYTVIGEPVNEAARLSELARTEPNRVLVSAVTVSAAPEREQRFWRSRRPVRLRGYDERVAVATLIGGH